MVLLDFVEELLDDDVVEVSVDNEEIELVFNEVSKDKDKDEDEALAPETVTVTVSLGGHVPLSHDLWVIRFVL